MSYSSEDEAGGFGLGGLGFEEPGGLTFLVPGSHSGGADGSYDASAARKNTSGSTPAAKADEATAKDAKSPFAFLDKSLISYDEAELVRFSQLAVYAEGNPRKLKRIVNSYAVSRALAISTSSEWYDFREKLLRWTVLCEIWPMRVSWILQLITDEQQAYIDKYNAHVAELALSAFYTEHVEARVFETDLEHCVKKVNEQYSDLFLLDGDPDLFDKLIAVKPEIKMKDLGDLLSRKKNALMSYTTNLNPAVRFSLGRITAHREEGDEGKRKLQKRYVRRSVLDLNNKIEPARQIPVGDLNANAEHAPGAAEIHKETSAQQKDTDTSSPTNASDAMEKTKTSGALCDSMQGQDLVGYNQYARVLSQLIFNLKTTPLVVGIFAGWGTGKSFIMNKMVMFVKYGATLQGLQEELEVEKAKKARRKPEAATRCEHCSKIFQNRRKLNRHQQTDCILAQVALFDKWLADEDTECIDAFWRQRSGKLTKEEEEAAAAAGFNLASAVKDFAVQLPMFVLMTICLPFYYAYLMISHCVKCGCETLCCRRGSKSMSTNRATMESIKERVDDKKAKQLASKGGAADAPRIRGKKKRKKGGSKRSAAEKEERAIPIYDYEFVWFNAWLFNGSDNLWAALVLKLYEGVEDHYGPEFKYAKRRAEVWKLIVATLVGTVVAFGVGVVSAHPEAVEAEDATSQTLTEIVAVLSSIASVAAIVFTAYKSATSASSLSGGLAADVAGGDMAGRLGFMDQVRSKLFKVAQLLESPQEIETTWDCFLPAWFPARDYIVKHFRDKHYGAKKRPCRFILFVDDLDRCEPDKCVEILQAINLMCEGLPFIIFLAIDPRVVVCSIETVNKNFYKNVGISGYMYLDKIVQLPFAIPELTSPEKKAMLRGFLTGKAPGTRDYTQIDIKDVHTTVLNTARGTDKGNPKEYPSGIGILDGMIIFTSHHNGSEMRDPSSFDPKNNDASFLCNVDLPRDSTFAVSADRQIFAMDGLNSKVNVYDAKRTGQTYRFELSDTKYKLPDGAGKSNYGVACSDSYLFVSSESSHLIYRFDLKTKPSDLDVYMTIGGVTKGKDGTSTHAPGDAKFSKPTGLDVMDNKFLLVADRGHNRVVKLDLQGKVIDDSFAKLPADNGLREPNSITHDPDGNVLIYDTINCRVVVCNAEGKYICSILDKNSTPTGESLFVNNGNTYCDISCCQESGRLVVAADDDHKIYDLKPYLY